MNFWWVQLGALGFVLLTAGHRQTISEQISTLLSSAPNTLKHDMCFRTYMKDPLQLEKCTFSAGYLIRVSGACGAMLQEQCDTAPVEYICG